MNNAFFLDRDGVIIEEEHYLSDPAKVRLCPGCAEAFKQISSAGFRIIVTSNQSGVARGYFTFAEIAAVERKNCSPEREPRCRMPGTTVPTIPKETLPNMYGTATAANPVREC